MSRCAQRESDRQLVAASRSRAVAVIPASEVAAQPIVNDRSQFLQRAQHLSGRVTGLATQRDARVVARSRGLGRWRVRIRRQGDQVGAMRGGGDTRERTSLKRPRAAATDAPASASAAQRRRRARPARGARATIIPRPNLSLIKDGAAGSRGYRLPRQAAGGERAGAYGRLVGDPSVLAVVATPRLMEGPMARFTDLMVPERVQPFWAALTERERRSSGGRDGRA